MTALTDSKLIEEFLGFILQPSDELKLDSLYNLVTKQVVL